MAMAPVAPLPDFFSAASGPDYDRLYHELVDWKAGF
jgi:hypothetical protein